MRVRRGPILIVTLGAGLAWVGGALAVDLHARLDQLNEKEKHLIEKLDGLRQRERDVQEKLDEVRVLKKAILDKLEPQKPGTQASGQTPASTP